jgi:outer membrane protein assembly factor BamB
MVRKTIAIGTVFAVLSLLLVPGALSTPAPVLAHNPMYQGSITLLQPKAGDFLVAGSAYTIRWSTSTPPAEATVVAISFTANGSDWEWVANAENNGAYPWTVPKVSTNQAQLSFSWSYADPPNSVLAEAFSGKFSIVPPLPPAMVFSPWPMVGGDAQHTCRSSLAVPELPQQLWSYDAHQPISSSLVVGPGGVIYFIADTALMSLNPDGSERWVQYLGGAGSTPAVGTDGTVYVCVEKQLLSYDSTGNWKWTYTTTTNPIGGVLTCPPIVADDGTIYLTAYMGTPGSHCLKAVSPDGMEKWSYPLSSPILPVVDKDGTIYLGSRPGETQGFLDAVKPDGSQLWRLAMLSAVLVPPTVNEDGSIYTIVRDGTFTALGPDGTELWRYAEPGDVLMEAGVAVGQGGLILYQIYTADSYQLVALDPNAHTKKWTFSGGGKEGPFCQQIVDRNGRIYVGSLAHTKIFVLDPEDGQLITTLITEDKVGSLAIGEDGILLATVGQKVAAFGAGNTPPKPPPTSFPDVPADYWASPEIMGLVGAGVINGYPDGSFKPEFPVTRAEFAKMAVLALSIAQATPATPSFPDLDPKEWYYGYVEGAVKYGLIKGYPDGTFQPQGNITLAEVLTVIVRTQRMLADPPGPPHTILLRDRDDSLRAITAADWFYQIVGLAAANGYLLFPDKEQIVKPGANSGEYEIRLNSPANRAQTAVLLSRIEP